MFDLHTSILDPEYGEELDEGRLEEYINGLMSEFAESPEAEAFMREFDASLGWPATYMHYAAQYFCATPATVRSRDNRIHPVVLSQTRPLPATFRYRHRLPRAPAACQTGRVVDRS